MIVMDPFILYGDLDMMQKSIQKFFIFDSLISFQKKP